MYDAKNNIVLSLNDYNKSWQKLRALKRAFQLAVTPAVRKAKVPKLKWMELRVYDNTNLDMDNVSGMIKPLVDLLRKKGIIEDDRRKFWDYLSIQSSKDIPKGYILFQITGELLDK